MNYNKIENLLNDYSDWDIKEVSDDGRVNSLNSENDIVKKINERVGVVKFKTYNREKYDLYLLEGEDLKILEPDNFTNTLSFTKLAKLLNLSGNSFKAIHKSYVKQKKLGELKLVDDYRIIFLNKKNKKFKICSLTELPINCIAVNPSNGIQTKIPKTLLQRSDIEKFELIHGLFIEYINKRILNHAKEWETAINGK
jgi:hypothetical protein